VKQLISGRHTPAMIVAVLALVAAVTGAAVAGPTATKSALSKKEKKQVRNIADSEINKLAPGLAVKSAATANSANTANTANSLTMYAHVNIPGALTGSNLGFGSVSHPDTGVYCFTGLARTPVGGTATVDYNDSLFEFAQFGLGVGISVCPAGTQAFVGTFDSSTGGASDAGFFVTLW
jgi:hypothetical protein